MKKNIVIYSLSALFVLGFASCEKDQTVKEERTAFLTEATKGWELTKATSSPAYEMIGGAFVTDLIEGGWLLDYEKDDLVVYESNGAVNVKPGNITDPAGYTVERNIGQWKFLDEEATQLQTQIPFFMDDEPENVDVLELTKNTLRFNYTYQAVDDPAKAVYTFTLTYTRK